MTEIRCLIVEHFGEIDLAHPSADPRVRLQEALQEHVDEALEKAEEARYGALERAEDALRAIKDALHDSPDDPEEIVRAVADAIEEWEVNR